MDNNKAGIILAIAGLLLASVAIGMNSRAGGFSNAPIIVIFGTLLVIIGEIIKLRKQKQ